MEWRELKNVCCGGKLVAEYRYIFLTAVGGPLSKTYRTWFCFSEVISGSMNFNILSNYRCFLQRTVNNYSHQLGEQYQLYQLYCEAGHVRLYNVIPKILLIVSIQIFSVLLCYCYQWDGSFCSSITWFKGPNLLKCEVKWRAHLCISVIQSCGGG